MRGVDQWEITRDGMRGSGFDPHLPALKRGVISRLSSSTPGLQPAQFNGPLAQ